MIGTSPDTRHCRSSPAPRAVGPGFAAAFLPERATVLRDGTPEEIEARLLVPGDVLLIEEGESICADARLMTGTPEVDM